MTIKKFEKKSAFFLIGHQDAGMFFSVSEKCGKKKRVKNHDAHD